MHQHFIQQVYWAQLYEEGDIIKKRKAQQPPN